MTLHPEPGPAPDLTPTAGQLATVLADVADLHDEVTALRQVHGQADTVTEQLANRLAVLEALTPPTAGAAGAAPASPYRYQELADWVDEVFARLGAAHRAKWCTNWAAHPEAHIRLEVLWHTWEAAMAATPGTEPQWAAVDEWLRVRLDHHVDKLLDVDGPFAGCIPARGADPGRCSAPPRLAQRPLVLAHDTALARLEAHRRRPRHPVAAGR
jgi:hypothetical protein